MKQSRIVKYQLLRLTLAVTLLCVWPAASIAQAAIADSVVGWGYNDSGQTTVPISALNGVTAIAAGHSHTVALKKDGSVVAWGSNQSGQVTGTPAIENLSSAIASPVTLGGQVLSGVTAIAAGNSHTVALKNDGTVVAWGGNSVGQMIIPLAAQSGVTAIAAGLGHTVALKNDGTVVAWGLNNHGQTAIPLAAQSGVTAIAAGDDHTVALKSDGSVVAWGGNWARQRTIPFAAQSGVTAIAAGSAHTVALKNDGTVVAWGWNPSGQVTGAPTSIPPYSAIASPVTLGGQVLSGVTAITAGSHHTVALKNDGTVVAWGDNGSGQVTRWSAAASPVTLGGQVLSGVTAIAAGSWHTVVLFIPSAPNITTQPVGQAVNVWQSASFTVGATGIPLNYQWRKDGVDLPGATSATYDLTFAQTYQAGNYTVVVSTPLGSVTSAPPATLTVNAVAAPGTVVAWGNNDYGQTTIPLAAQSGIVAIAAGGEFTYNGPVGHTVVLKDDGAVVAWGLNNHGQTTVPLAAQSGVTAIAAGSWHTVALKNDGAVVAWGANWSGQVTGTPTNEDPYSATASPVTLEGQVLSGVTAIAAGNSHTVALKNDGTVVTWGGNNHGQTTIPLTAQSGVSAIAAGMFHTVALKIDGTVVAWGDNPRSTTVPLAAQSGVTAIAAGYSHTVALKNDGTVVAWGWNGYGQVTGNPNDSEIANPVTLGGHVLSGVTAIAAGNDHTVALKNDGSVVAWGANWSGQVTGTPTNGDPSTAIASPVTLGGQVLTSVTAIAEGGNHTVALIGGMRLLPSLKARPDGNDLILSWPTNAPGFTVQSTLDLTPPVTWLDSTSVPTVIDAQFTVTNTTSGGAQFYRLRKI